MKTTRILTVLTAFILVFGLAACGTSKDNKKNDGNKKTLDEIGSIYGVSRERIRQIENRAISKLKKLCKNKNLTSGLKNYFGG